MKVIDLLEPPTMNYEQFVSLFVDEVLPNVVHQYGDDDVVAAREAFNDMQDSMGSNGDLESGWEGWAGLPDSVEKRMQNGEWTADEPDWDRGVSAGDFE